jgi:hypothetical protein
MGIEKFDEKVVKQMQRLSDSEATRTFSQVGERHDRQKFTTGKTLVRSRLGKRHAAFME